MDFNFVFEWLTTFNITVTAIILFVLLLGYGSSTFLTWKKLGIKGPMPLPFIGTGIHFIRKGLIFADPTLCKKYGRVFGTYEGRTPCLMVTDPDLLKNIMVKDFNYFSNRRPLQISMRLFDKSLLFLRDDHWKKIRNTVTPSFSSAKLKQLTILINHCCETLVENLQEKVGQSIEMREFVQNFAADVIASCAFATEVNSQKSPNHPFVVHMQKIVKGNQWKNLIFLLMPKIDKLLRLFGKTLLAADVINYYEKTIDEIISMRKEKKQKRPDFLQLLLDVENEELEEYTPEENTTKTPLNKVDGSSLSRKGLTPQEIMGQCITFIFAGFDTVSVLLSFAAYLLAIHPEIQDRLFEEIDEVLCDKENVQYEDIANMTYLDQVVCETLRLYPPAARIDRHCCFDYKINNLFIPKGCVITIPVYAIHHDEQFWPDPETFDPERFSPDLKPHINPFTYMPFGQGPRNCIAMRFALLEAKLMMVHVLRKFKYVRGPETQVPIKLKKFSSLNGENGVWVKVEAR